MRPNLPEPPPCPLCGRGCGGFTHVLRHLAVAHGIDHRLVYPSWVGEGRCFCGFWPLCGKDLDEHWRGRGGLAVHLAATLLNLEGHA